MTDEEINMIINIVKSNKEILKKMGFKMQEEYIYGIKNTLELDKPENRKKYNDDYYAKKGDALRQYYAEKYRIKQDEFRLFPKWFIKDNKF